MNKRQRKKRTKKLMQTFFEPQMLLREFESIFIRKLLKFSTHEARQETSWASQFSGQEKKNKSDDQI